MPSGGSDHSITGKHFPCSGVSGSGAELGIDGGVLDILVAEPVFGKVDVFTGIEDVGSDGVLEGAELLFFLWDTGELAIPFHQQQKHSAVNGEFSVG